MNDYDDDGMNDHDRILPLLLPPPLLHLHDHENARESNLHDAYASHACGHYGHVACDHGNGCVNYDCESDRGYDAR